MKYKMTGQQFIDALELLPELKVLGIVGGKLIVSNTFIKATFSVDHDILKNDWADVEAVLLGQRQPKALSHLTRIAGYYSQIENWNKSKLGELADRRKGDYGVKLLGGRPEVV